MKNKITRKSKPSSIDLMVLICLPLLAATISWLAPINFLVSTLLFFGLPDLYLFFRKRDAAIRCIIFSGTFTFLAVIVDYLAAHDQAWTVPTIFSFKVASVISVEDLILAFLFNYLVVGFYELFFDHVPHKTIGGRMPYLYLLVALSFAVLIFPTFINGHTLTIGYFYLKIGFFLMLLPLVAFSVKFPRFLKIFLKTIPYFLGLTFLNEIVSLHKGYWFFPGNHFIGWINLGGYHFPFEELIFWMILSSAILIAYFETFDDNRLKLHARH